MRSQGLQLQYIRAGNMASQLYNLDYIEKHMGLQVTFYIDESVLNEIDRRAKASNQSRSNWISQVLSTYIEHQTNVDFNVKHFETMLQEKDRVIEGLQADKRFLEGHISQLAARLEPPRQGFWHRLFGA